MERKKGREKKERLVLIANGVKFGHGAHHEVLINVLQGLKARRKDIYRPVRPPRAKNQWKKKKGEQTSDIGKKVGKG